MKCYVYRVNGVEWKLLAVGRNCSYQVLLQKVESDDFPSLMPTQFHLRLVIDKENAFLYNTVDLENLMPGDVV